MGTNTLLEGEIYCTSGGNLKCKCVVHAVGPVYSDEKQNSDLLAECVRLSLQSTTDKQFKSIAIPAISTGSNHYPIKDACYVIVKSLNTCLSTDGLPSTIKEIYLCDSDPHKVEHFTAAIEKVFKKSQLMNILPGRKRLPTVTTHKKGTYYLVHIIAFKSLKILRRSLM